MSYPPLPRFLSYLNHAAKVQRCAVRADPLSSDVWVQGVQILGLKGFR